MSEYFHQEKSKKKVSKVYFFEEITEIIKSPLLNLMAMLFHVLFAIWLVGNVAML